MAEQRKRTVRKTTVKRAGTRRTGRKKSGGHGCLFPLLFFIAAAVAAYFVFLTPPAEPAAVGEPAAIERVTESVREAGESVAEAVSGKTEEKVSEEKTEKEKKPPAEETKKEIKQETKRVSPKTETKKTETQTSAKPKAAAKAAAPAVRGKLAVVIDDAGRDMASQRVYEKMGIPLTLAVMPNQSHTGEAAAEWAQCGLPVIIHQPMESVSGSGMEPIVLLTSMSETEMKKMLADSFRQIPQAVGMNNHQGSKATTDRHTMNVVMAELSKRGMFFLDSATNTTTEAGNAAAAYGVPSARNELFVDNSTDIEEIKAMIRKGASRAIANGTYILIGHCRPNTAEAFRQVVPELRAKGIEFIYVSRLMK